MKGESEGNASGEVGTEFEDDDDGGGVGAAGDGGGYRSSLRCDLIGKRGSDVSNHRLVIEGEPGRPHQDSIAGDSTAVEEADESHHLRQWRPIAEVSSGLGPRREALIFCYAACNWANHLPLSDRRNTRELFIRIASRRGVPGSGRNADSPLRGGDGIAGSTKKEIGGLVEGKTGEDGIEGGQGGTTTRRGLSLDVIDVVGHEVGMERTVLRTRTTSALVIGRPRPLQILGYRRISPGFWWL
ncbi:hypothetical protein EAG_05817 [Camponotus floridanus]|uniref:Uncharacterized protein n=1 Tax=Camponotus floridanus TaxID=104421 RepID=E2AZN3_CAMFO|nr:hypothetical protein EAG_05817 [Camponotus floridanus]